MRGLLVLVGFVGLGLGSVAEASPDKQLAMTDLEGPFPSLAKYCAGREQDACDPTDSGLESADGESPTGPFHATTKTAWVREAVVFRDGDVCPLGLQVSNGDWYVLNYLTECHNSGTERMHMTGDEIAIRDVTGDSKPEVVLRYSVFQFHHMDGGATTQVLMTCGIGKSGKPTCTQVITLTASRTPLVTGKDGDREEGPTRTIELAWKFTRRGGVLTRKAGKLTPQERASLGTYVIAFP
jgi:hypothetical protein